MDNEIALLPWSKLLAARGVFLFVACAHEKTDVPAQPRSRTEQQLASP
jgi:hypothetical protein